MILNPAFPMASSHPSPVASPPVAHPFGPRLFVGMLGVLVAAIMSGLNGRVAAVALLDVRAPLGAGSDDGSWITVIYAACELAAMPISGWLSVTFSFRRYHIAVVAVFSLLALLLPFIHSLPLLVFLRGAQGFFGGLLIPVLMAGALRFFPLPLRLYGLALYALTATFSPNLAVWLAAIWTDQLSIVSMLYLQVLPLAAFSMLAVAWGIPQDPVRLERWREVNVIGLLTGPAGLALVAIALGQGERLDWLDSGLIRSLLSAGIPMLTVFVCSEWFHPTPFMRFQLLYRRNLGLGFTIFFVMLIVMLSGSLLPMDYLLERWHFRLENLYVIGAILGLPQLVLGPMVSMLLYKQWVDARCVFALGLACIAISCLLGWRVTADWNAADFVAVQVLQALGQPMAVVSVLFLSTSVVQPMEGPFVSGIVNTLRALGTLGGSALVGHLLAVRAHFHGNVLLDRAMTGTADARHRIAGGEGAIEHGLAELAEFVNQQATVLGIADCYLILGALALLLIPLVLNLQYMQPPLLTPKTNRN